MWLRPAEADGAFVGRTELLERLLAQWELARAGTPRLVVVEGPAGIGKTALVRAFLRAADDPRAMRASGDELESRLSFGIVDQLTHRTDEPELASGQGDPLSVGAELVRLLGEASADGPLVVVVDDAHWADTSSLQALSFAFRRLHAEPVLVVVVSRREPLASPLERVAAGDRGLVLDVGGLSVDELVELAAQLGAGPLSRAAAARLEAHTGGNPLYATSLLQELGVDALLDAGPLPAPEAFRMSVLARVASCPMETEQLVTAAAVLGQRCRLVDAGRLAEVPDPAGALEPAVDAGLLATEGLPLDGITFSHPLVRAAVYQDLGPARRQRLHLRAADLVDEESALDHRSAAALGDDPELAAVLTRRAHEEAAAGTWAAAAAHLEAAMRVEPDVDRRGEMLLEAVEMLLRGGEVAAALARLPRVEALPDSARRCSVLGHLALVTGRQADAEQLLARAWDAARLPDDVEVAAAAAALLSQLCLSHARGTESCMWARRTLDLDTHEGFARGVALSVLVGALTIQGRGAEGLALVETLPEAAAARTPEEVEGVFARGVSRLWTGDFRGAEADLTVMSSAQSGWRPVRVRGISLAYLAVAEFHLGAWDASIAHSELAVSLTRDGDYAMIFPLVRYSAAMALSARGHWEAAEAHVTATRQAAEMTGDESGVGYAGTAAAWLAYCRGDPAGIVDALEAVRGIADRDGIAEPGVMPWHGVQVEALVKLDRLDEARRALEPFAERAEERGHTVALAQADRARGLLETACGNTDAARAAFEGAVERLTEEPVPFERARAAELAGAALRRQGERARAADLLLGARDTYLALGAEPFRVASDRELAACGRTPARRRSEGRLTLTAQELAVARLVAGGMSNKEVAQELVLSVKTIEFHLGNAYAKLGVRSRTQLAVRMGESSETPSV